MNPYFTKDPIVGTPLTPSVIKQINTAVRRFMPIAGPGIRTSVTAGGTIISAIPAPASKKPKDKPLPFEVRYDGTLDNGAGGWKIYLPTEHLVQFDGVYLDPLNDVTPILDANGDETGWYSFDEITLQDDHVWLVVTVTESSGSIVSVDAEFAASEGQAVSDEKVVNICIAEVSYEEPEDEGGTPTVEIKQSVVGAIVMSSGGGGGGGVVPDDISTEFIPDPPAGTQPDGDEGELQIKGFKSGQPADTNTIAEYLMGTAQISGQVWLIVRGKSTGGGPALGYIPLDALNLYEYAKKTDLPTVGNGTLTIKQGTTTLGNFTANQATPATVTIPEPPTPPTLSDTPALDVVPSTGQASAGVAATASRQDHVHKMPATVVLTDVDQTINSVKTIGPLAGSAVARLDFQHTANGERARLQHRTYNGQEVFQIYLVGVGLTPGNIVTIQGTYLELGARATGTGAIDDVRLGTGADAALANIEPSTSSRRIADVKWVTTYFQQKLTAGSNITISGNTISATQPTVNNGTLTIKQGTTTLGTFTANQSDNTTVTIPTPTTPPSGTVNFIGNMRWNTTTHTLQKRVDSLNMATGAVTQGSWSDITNGGTTPISSIIPQSS